MSSLDLRKIKSHQFYLLRRRQAVILYIFISLAIAGMVPLGMNLLKLEMVPKPVLELTPWFAGFTFFFAVTALIYYFANRFRIVLKKDRHHVSIAIHDPELKEAVYAESPMKVYRQWTLVHIGDNKVRSFRITICDPKDQPLISIEGGIGKWKDVPKGFEFRPAAGALTKGKYIYESRKIVQLSELLKH